MARYRNKLMHFYDMNHLQEETTAVAAIQCTVWYHIHRLIVEDWGPVFGSYVDAIDELNGRMLELRRYLEVRYQELLPAINEDAARGAEFIPCQACGFEAYERAEQIGPLSINRCRVCGNETRYLNVPCPNCGNDILTQDPVEFQCPDCGQSLDLDYILHVMGDQVGDRAAAHDAVGNAYCSVCESVAEPTVAAIGEQWVCLSCLSSFATIEHCDWCGSPVAGIARNSALYGCVMCGGLFGYEGLGLSPAALTDQSTERTSRRAAFRTCERSRTE